MSAALTDVLAASAPPAPPPGAFAPTHDYAWGLRINICGLAALRAAEAAAGRRDIADILLPAALSWPDVARHYDAALPDWRAEDVPVPGGDCAMRLRVWRRGADTLAVSLLDETFAAAEGPVKVLFILTPHEGG